MALTHCASLVQRRMKVHRRTQPSALVSRKKANATAPYTPGPGNSLCPAAGPLLLYNLLGTAQQLASHTPSDSIFFCVGLSWLPQAPELLLPSQHIPTPWPYSNMERPVVESSDARPSSVTPPSPPMPLSPSGAGRIQVILDPNAAVVTTQAAAQQLDAIDGKLDGTYLGKPIVVADHVEVVNALLGRCPLCATVPWGQQFQDPPRGLNPQWGQAPDSTECHCMSVLT